MEDDESHHMLEVEELLEDESKECVRAEQLVRERLRPQEMSDAELARHYPRDALSLSFERRNLLVLGAVHWTLLAGLIFDSFFVARGGSFQLFLLAQSALGAMAWLLLVPVWFARPAPAPERALRGTAAFFGVAHALVLLPFLVENRHSPQFIFGDQIPGDAVDRFAAAVVAFVLNAMLVPNAVLFARSPWRPMGEAGCMTPESRHPQNAWDTQISTGNGRKTYRVCYKDRVVFSGFMEEFEALPFPDPGRK